MTKDENTIRHLLIFVHKYYLSKKPGQNPSDADLKNLLDKMVIAQGSSFITSADHWKNAKTLDTKLSDIFPKNVYKTDHKNVRFCFQFNPSPTSEAQIVAAHEIKKAPLTIKIDVGPLIKAIIKKSMENNVSDKKSWSATHILINVDQIQHKKVLNPLSELCLSKNDKNPETEFQKIIMDVLDYHPIAFTAQDRNSNHDKSKPIYKYKVMRVKLKDIEGLDANLYEKITQNFSASEKEMQASSIQIFFYLQKGTYKSAEDGPGIKWDRMGQYWTISQFFKHCQTQQTNKTPHQIDYIVYEFKSFRL